MINQPDASEYAIDDIIDNQLHELRAALKKMGIEIAASDFIYQFLSREEWLGVPSDIIYPGEDLPGKFGVYRGYNGGGMHSSLAPTEIDRMSPRRQAKATRALELFKTSFWAILKAIDEASEAESGQTLQPWERQTI